MSPDQLAFYSGWASIIGLAVSLASLAYVRSIKANIIRYQRKQRLRFLIELHSLLTNGGRAALVEALKDLRTFSEGL